jgi:hypothetical protein
MRLYDWKGKGEMGCTLIWLFGHSVVIIPGVWALEIPVAATWLEFCICWSKLGISGRTRPLK